MRICLASSLFRPVVGGEEHHAGLLAEQLVLRGHRVSVLTQRVAGAPRRECVDGIEIERAVRPLFFGPCYPLSYVACVARFLLARRGAFDLVQASYLFWDAVAVALVKRALRLPLVVRVVIGGPGGDVDRFLSARLWPRVAGLDRHLVRRLAELVLRRADAFVVLNAATRAELVGRGVPPGRCHVVPNGIDVARFSRRPRPSTLTGHRLLTVARLGEQKGLDVLLRALPGVRREVSDVTLTIVGVGPLRDSLQALAQQLGIADVVCFHGAAADVVPLFAQADAFVLPSRYEGMPLALLEAMAAGVPAIATDVPGNRDVVRAGVDGLLVPVEDAEALAQAITRVLGDGRVAARLAASAREQVTARYSVEQMVDRTLDVYRLVTA